MKKIATSGDKAIAIIKICLIVLSILAVVADCFYVWANVESKKLITNQVVYAGLQDAAEVATDEEKPYFMHINLYENLTETGVELQEIKFTYLNDHLNKQPYVVGYQYVGDYKNGDKPVVDYGKIFWTNVQDRNHPLRKEDERLGRVFSWYNGWSGETWRKYTQINHDEILPLFIGENMYGLRLDKWTQGKKLNLWVASRNDHICETYGTLFEYIMKCVKENTYGKNYHNKDYVLHNVDLKDFFSVYEYDTQKNAWKSDGLKSYEEHLYMDIRVSYKENGATLASDSLFKQIKHDPTYNTTGISGDVLFGNYGTRYIISNEDFKLRYSAVQKGYLLSLRDEISAYLNGTDRVTVNVNIDLSSFNVLAVGLDINALNGIAIDELVIRGAGTFYFYDRSLYNTGLKTIRRNELVTLYNVGNATNNNFKEVII
jgi:hypothetical protein